MEIHEGYLLAMNAAQEAGCAIFALAATGVLAEVAYYAIRHYKERPKENAEPPRGRESKLKEKVAQ